MNDLRKEGGGSLVQGFHVPAWGAAADEVRHEVEGVAELVHIASTKVMLLGMVVIFVLGIALPRDNLGYGDGSRFQHSLEGGYTCVVWESAFPKKWGS
jgi:hypothetical protein